MEYRGTLSVFLKLPSGVLSSAVLGTKATTIAPTCLTSSSKCSRSRVKLVKVSILHFSDAAFLRLCFHVVVQERICHNSRRMTKPTSELRWKHESTMCELLWNVCSFGV